MKQLLFFFALQMGASALYSQNNAQTEAIVAEEKKLESIRIFQSDSLVRGLYKNYREFLYNSPSYKTKFAAVAKLVNKEDSSLLAAGPVFPDGEKKIDDAWGFCTGDEVFVRNGGLQFKNYYWKLESIGTYSYFRTLSDNHPIILPGVGPGGLAFIVATGNKKPSNAFLAVIDTTGKIRRADFSLLKKLLRPHPALLKSFKEAAEPYEEYEYGNRREDEGADTQDTIIRIMKTYLDKLNEELKNNERKTE